MKDPQLMFEHPLMNRRGLIKLRLEKSEPDLKFYEWEKEKDKVTKIAAQFKLFVEIQLKKAKKRLRGRRLQADVKKYIELKSDLAVDSDAKECNFTFEATYHSPKQIDIQVNFSEPLKMSKGEAPDFILLYLWGLPFIRSSDNQKIFREPTAFVVRIPL